MKAPMPKSVVVLGKRHAVLVEKTTLNQHIMGNYKPFQSLLTIDAVSEQRRPRRETRRDAMQG